MAGNGTPGRIQTMYVKGTSERIIKLCEEVAPVLQKPQGQVTKEELGRALDSVSKLRYANPPLNHVEELNRLALHQSLVNRAAVENLMTPQEIMGRADTLRLAMSIPGGGGGMGGIRQGARGGPILPRTTATSGRNGVVTRARLPQDVAVNKVPPPAGTLADRMEKIKARTSEQVADRNRVAALIRKARAQGDPGVPQLVSRLEKNGVRIKDTNHLTGSPLREVDIETVGGKIIQVKKLSSAQKIIGQIQDTEKSTGQPVIGFIVDQHKKANSIVQQASRHAQVANKIDELVKWLGGE
jgi:hypothetical protein